MKSYRSTWIALFVFAGLLGLLWGVNQFLPADVEAYEGVPPDGKWKNTAAEWRSLLTPEQYRITREGGTERACSGGFCDTKADGVYVCVGCGQALFDSRSKFDSGTGWPSFFQPVDREHVSLRTDRSLFMRRTEVVCSRCDAHLGHVFRDGPPPTGLRFCINSAALKHLGRKE